MKDNADVLNFLLLCLIFLISNQLSTGIFSFSIEPVSSSNARLPSCKLLNFLPDMVVGKIASYLEPDCVLHDLIPACPGLAAKLCNQVAWDELKTFDPLVYVRSVALASVRTVSSMAVPCVPAQPAARGKWQRLLASDKMKRLRIGNPCYVVREKVRDQQWDGDQLLSFLFENLSARCPQRHDLKGLAP
jgi:hypothetical protein